MLSYSKTTGLLLLSSTLHALATSSDSGPSAIGASLLILSPAPTTSAPSTSTAPSSTGRPKSYTPVTATLADGSSYKAGSFNATLRWQSTGVLQHGGCPTDAIIGDCYSLYLSASGMLEPEAQGSSSRNKRRIDDMSSYSPSAFFYDPYSPDLGVDSPQEYFTQLLATSPEVSSMDPDLRGFLQLSSTQSDKCNAQVHKANGPRSPRQRIEILSWPPAAAGESWEYTWRTYLDPITQATGHFFHMMQLLHRDGCSGFVIALDAQPNAVEIMDKYRKCPNGVCASYDLNRYKGRTMQHDIRVTYGPSGTFDYVVRDLTSGNVVLEYNAIGDMGSSSSVKFGLYRAAVQGMGEARGYVGDYAARKVA